MLQTQDDAAQDRADSVSNGVEEAEIRSCNRVELVNHLDQALESHWRRWRRLNPQLRNGCFHESFVAAVTRVRSDVEYGVLHGDGSRVIGIIPFQRVGRHTAQPAGGRLNDFHGVLSGSRIYADRTAVLKALRLTKFDFHALAHDFDVPPPHNQAKCVYRVRPCPAIELSGGMEAYKRWLLKHSSTVKRQPQKTRALIRKHGELRVELDCRDPEILERVIHWKRARWQRSRTFDILKLDWTSNLVREVFATREDEFRGLLSVLWAGDTPVAGHMGFLSQGILHYWIPANDHDFRRYSPGTALMRELTTVLAEEAGIERVDLGHGESPLKDRFANTSTQIEQGCFCANSLRQQVGRYQSVVREAIRDTPGKEWIKMFLRPLYPNLGQGEFR